MGTKLTQSLLSNINLSFLEKRKIAYVISSLILTTSLISLSFQGLNQGVDFVGGRSYTIRFDKIISPNAVQSTLINTLEVEVKTFGNENQLKITTKYKVDVEGLAVDNEIQNILYNSLLSFLPDGYTYDQFVNGSNEKQVGIMSSIKVGPTIADDIKENSFLAVIGSLIVVFLYILLRFRKMAVFSWCCCSSISRCPYCFGSFLINL